MRVVKLIFLFLPVLFTLFSHAQTRNYRFERLEVDDGLSHSYVHGITQDSKGFIWISTYDGLNRYDGNEFKVFYPEPDNPNSVLRRSTRSVKEDKKGYLWMRYFRSVGISRYDPVSETFRHYFHNPSDPGSISDNHILTLHVDNSGEFWLGTSSGLNRYNYDTNDFERYLTDDSVDHLIHKILPDEKGHLWVASNTGLYLLHKSSGTLSSFFHESTNDKSLSNNIVRNLAYDHHGNLWIVTAEGIDVLYQEQLAAGDPENYFFLRLYDFPGSIDNHLNVNMLADSKGQFWISGHFGVIRYSWNPNTKKFSSKKYFTEVFDVNDTETFIRIYEDSNEDIWLGSSASSIEFGLRRFNEHTQKFSTYKFDKNEPNSIGGNIIGPLYEDRSGVLWIGTNKNGVCRLDINQKPFHRIYRKDENEHALMSNVVYSVTEDSRSRLWIGTEKGLTIYNPANSNYAYYSPGSKGKFKIQSWIIGCFKEDNNGDMWVGYYDSQFSRYHKATDTFIEYIYDGNDEYPIEGWSYRSIIQDRNNTIWLGSSSNGLIEQYDNYKFRTYEHKKDDPSSISDNFIWTIYQAPYDDEDVLWIGTIEGGLNRFDIASSSFTHYMHEAGNPESIPSNEVKGILQTEKGKLWLTTSNGFCKFDMQSGEFRTYTIDDGLPINSTQAVLQDSNGFLWISTNIGLSKFDPPSEKFKNYDKEDGLISNEFHEVAKYKNKSGVMYFGGKNGVTFFHPDSIIDNPFLPEVSITGLMISNLEISVGDSINEKIVLNNSITYTKNIELPHDQKDITLTFSAFHYANPSKNQYKYKLEGFDDQWKRATGQNPTATYTNLSPDLYTFKIKASNNDGIWNNNELTFDIRILPPWWLTWWAKLYFSVTIIGMVFMAHLLRVRVLKKQTRQLERKVEKRTFELSEKNYEIAAQNEELLAQSEELSAQNDQLESLNNSIIEQKNRIDEINQSLEKKVEKRTWQLNETIDELNKTISELDRFVYSASHDLSAPLKSIKGIINLTKYDNLNAGLYEKIGYIEKSIDQLEKVIANLIEFSRNSRLDLEITDVPIQQLINDCFNELKYIKQDYTVNLILDFDGSKHLRSDRLRLKIIANNLISNAIKYQDDRKADHFIKISLNEKRTHWTIDFEDNGIGIDKDNTDRVFDMFFRATEKSNGSGLGLYIVRESVKKLGGEISLESYIDKGTIFHVSLPKIE